MDRPHIDGLHLIHYLLGDDLVHIIFFLLIIAMHYSKPIYIYSIAVFLLNYLLYRASYYPFLYDFDPLYSVFLGEVVIIDLIAAFYLQRWFEG